MEINGFFVHILCTHVTLQIEKHLIIKATLRRYQLKSYYRYTIYHESDAFQDPSEMLSEEEK